MINDRQFIISEKPMEYEGWISCCLKNGKALSWHKDLNVYISESKSVVLLGHCWQTKRESKSPIEELKELENHLSIERIYEVEKYWCGRYVLIVNDLIFLDASGLLSVYYSAAGISSSANLLLQQEGKEYQKPKLYAGMMPDFFPGTLSGYDGIRRVLPSQVLNIVDNSTINRPLLPFEKMDLANEMCLELFEDLFEQSSENMADHFKGSDLMVALTGGRDSRVLLALLIKSKVEFKAFTLQHPTISDGDAKIPQLLCDKLGIEYKYVPRNKENFSSKRLDDYKEHTAHRVIDKDCMFYAHNQYQGLVREKPIVILRSGIWACTTNYYEMHTGTDCSSIEDISKYFKMLKLNTEFKTEFENWLQATKQDKLNQNLSIDNRLYWEFRNGNWLGDIEQSFDMMDNITSIQPLNCRALLYYLISMKDDFKKNKHHEEILVRKCCSKVADIPYDYKVSISRAKKLRKKVMSGISKYIWLCVNYGPCKAFKYFC